MNKWQSIWNKRKDINHVDVLQSLIDADGFDSPTGKLEVHQWLKFAQNISEKSGIVATDSIFEVGCGSGAFLYNFYSGNHKVSGIDYSESLIEIAKKVMPKGKFMVCEADKINTDEKFDVVVSNSVFQYFESFDYATNVLNKMFLKAAKKVLLLDINDFELKETAEKIRMGKLGEEEYKIKYKGLEHLYYKKDFFMDFASRNNCLCNIFPQEIENYGCGSYRYNVILTKK